METTRSVVMWLRNQTVNWPCFTEVLFISTIIRIRNLEIIGVWDELVGNGT